MNERNLMRDGERMATFRTDEFGIGSLTAGSNAESPLSPREYQFSQCSRIRHHAA